MLESDSYYNPVFRNFFLDLTRIHLPYLGLLFAFSSIIILDFFVLKKRGDKLSKILSVFCVVLLLFSIMIFSARMAFLAFCISMGYYFFKKISKKKILFFLAGFAVLVYLISFLNPVQRRVKELANMNFILPKKDMASDKVNFRFVVYNCSFQVLNEYWLMGAGLGNTQEALNKCYDKIEYENYDDFSKITYNTHSQYLDELLTHGLFGFLIFIIPMIYFFVKSRGLYRGFLILVFLCLLTENMFNREVGVIFFTLFNTLFYLAQTNKIMNKDSYIFT